MATLHGCIKHGGTFIDIQLLVDGGADVNSRNNWGETPLHAFNSRYFRQHSEDSLKMLNLLIEVGSNVNAETECGTTPLMSFIYNGFPYDHLEVLLSKGANVNHTNIDGDSGLHCFALGYKSKIGNESLKVLKVLVERSSCIDNVSIDGHTPLMNLLNYKYPLDHIMVLLERGSNVNLRNRSGDSILDKFLFVYRSNPGAESLEILKTLIEMGANVNCVNKKGETPLMKILEYRYPLDHFVIVLEKDKNINIKYKKLGDSILHKFLYVYKSDTLSERLKVLKSLVERTASVDCVNDLGETPLMKLLEYGYPHDHLMVLLEKGANTKHTDNWGVTVIHNFLQGYKSSPVIESLNILKSLVERGVNLDCVTEKGESPLKLIKAYFTQDHFEVCKHLS